MLRRIMSVVWDNSVNDSGNSTQFKKVKHDKIFYIIRSEPIDIIRSEPIDKSISGSNYENDITFKEMNINDNK